MAQENLIRQTCDYCGDKHVFPQQVRPEDAEQLSFWITLVRMYKVRDQIFPVTKHACKDSCASNIISLGMLKLPQEIQDSLDEEKRLAHEFQRKLAESRRPPQVPADHPFTSMPTPDDPTGQQCAVEGCNLTAIAHPAGEA